MTATMATTYQEVINYATRNVWTLFLTPSEINSALDAWRQTVFAIDGIPTEIKAWEQVALNVVNNTPSSADTNIFIPYPARTVIQRIAIAFRDNDTTGGDAVIEAAFVAAFNANWV